MSTFDKLIFDLGPSIFRNFLWLRAKWNVYTTFSLRFPSTRIVPAKPPSICVALHKYLLYCCTRTPVSPSPHPHPPVDRLFYFILFYFSLNAQHKRKPFNSRELCPDFYYARERAAAISFFVAALFHLFVLRSENSTREIIQKLSYSWSLFFIFHHLHTRVCM